ncbi:F-box family protein [Raphanus sativus]|uniref:F-box protein At3g28330-like n=1 Tax=Raphanus sativus TaxID=3726 RepID=A0A6J0NCY0_RAPSA|nr:F-box protein At3g28330-like [Raphanus sativus]KAJ4902313.1 F-box family protein [Raphanus sativus]
MVFLPDDLCATILSRLPIKTFTSFKLVCKQWNSVVESLIFRDLFIAQHQNTQSSSWSLIMGAANRTEFLAHYKCNTWGLQRSLDSYISSFIACKFENQKDNYRRGSVVAYSDAGFILIDVSSYTDGGWNFEKLSLLVANPVSQECIEIDAPKAFENSGIFLPFGIATRTDNGVVVSYKIVASSAKSYTEKLDLMIYSSETGLWSRIFPLPSKFERCHYTISLNGNLHWLSRNNDELLSMDFNATTKASSPFRYTAFPDLDKHVKFRRACTTYQGSLMYMNIVSQVNDDRSVDHKLCLWRLKSWEWQLISEVSTSLTETNFDYIPLRINSFDATTAYFLSQKHQCLIAINLRNGECLLHSELERTSGGRILSSVHLPQGSFFHSFVLPQWLYRLPR